MTVEVFYSHWARVNALSDQEKSGGTALAVMEMGWNL